MRPTSSWTGKRGFSDLLVLLAAVTLAVAGCSPSGPAASTSAPDGARVPGPPKVVRIDNRKENTAGISIFATNNASQRETTWTFHAGLTAYDAQSNLVGRLAARVPSVAAVIGR